MNFQVISLKNKMLMGGVFLLLATRVLAATLSQYKKKQK